MLKVIEAIPYKDFKEKIKITKEYNNTKAKIEVLKGIIYIERYEVEV